MLLHYTIQLRTYNIPLTYILMYVMSYYSNPNATSFNPQPGDNPYIQMRNQVTVSANMIVSVFVMFGIGYMVGVNMFEGETAVSIYILWCLQECIDSFIVYFDSILLYIYMFNICIAYCFCYLSYY